MDGGAWWATVHGVAKSRTRLSNFTFTFHFHALEKEMPTHSSVLAWRIPGTGEPGGLPSMGSHRVGHDWSDLAAAASLYKDSGDKFHLTFNDRKKIVSVYFVINLEPNLIFCLLGMTLALRALCSEDAYSWIKTRLIYHCWSGAVSRTFPPPLFLYGRRSRKQS